METCARKRIDMSEDDAAIEHKEEDKVDEAEEPEEPEDPEDEDEDIREPQSQGWVTILCTSMVISFVICCAAVALSISLQ
jgi:hypothetical protein